MQNVKQHLKTILLFSILSTFLVSIGYFIGGIGGFILMLTISLVINFLSYWFSDRVVLAIAKARKVDEKGYPEIFEITTDLARKMGIASPKIYIKDTDQMNAFATGRNQNNASICLTTGLINGLERDEIEGVIAHELAHIKNYDVLIATICAVIVSSISLVSDLVFFNSIFGSSEEENNGQGILFLVLAPIISTLIQLAISRSREYSADYTASKFTKNPKALANALIKIESAMKKSPMKTNPGLVSLYIQNPMGLRNIAEIFSTHPATNKRVSRLYSYSFN